MEEIIYLLQLNYLIIRIQAGDLVDSKKFLLIQLNFFLSVDAK